ncbi:MAG TPA: aminomethyl-transferring glycine dehydrogenase subunit GcvPA [Clostridiales bacterium]|nr:aminomethyl-transferring glycine dehydrogenase subunit GcvPA [Clostridiales bacterium]
MRNYTSRYIPNTEEQQKSMLETMGMKSLDEIFKDIPEELKLNRALNIPDDMAEYELIKHMQNMASKNANMDDYVCFLGAGAYDHYIPSIIRHMLMRGEFYTAYTPYQPEISQGTLQAIFEYQTMICELTGMDVANASMYDGASAATEAIILACNGKRKNEVVISAALNPEYKKVINTYARFNGFKVIEAAYCNGITDISDLEKKITGDTAAVFIQSPNFFGAIEDLTNAGQIAHKNDIYFIVSVDPISLGILKPPAEYGAHIVVGEGQALGNPMGFGGPYLGFFAVKKELMRKMPGRIVGQTTDVNGKRGFVLTMQTREQHIRREKATSNICTNQALNALTATIYLTVLGKKGLKEVGELCVQKSHYAYDRLLETGKFEAAFTSPFFKEFALKAKNGISIEELNMKLLNDKIIGGYDLGKDFEEMKDGWLVAVTEKRSKEDIDRLVEKVNCL